MSNGTPPTLSPYDEVKMLREAIKKAIDAIEGRTYPIPTSGMNLACSILKGALADA